MHTKRIHLITSHGKLELDYSPDERMLDVLFKNHIPWSAVTVYSRASESSRLELFPFLEKAMCEVDGIFELVIYYNRNVNPTINMINDLLLVPSENGVVTLNIFIRSWITNLAQSKTILSNSLLKSVN